MLIRLYELLIGRKSCQHKWVIHREHRLLDEGIRVGSVFVMRCDQCGDIKQKVITGN